MRLPMGSSTTLVIWWSTVCCILLVLSTTKAVTGAKKKSNKGGGGGGGQKGLVMTVEYKPDDCEQVADNGDQVFVHYTGYFENGDIFDSSIKQNKNPVEFILGESMVIQGWEQGVRGMCVGEKRKLVIPPHLAYGKSGRPPVIPPDATLTFETQLVKIVKSKPKSPELEQRFFQMLQFLTIPILTVYLGYTLYKKYQSETGRLKEKKERKKKR